MKKYIIHFILFISLSAGLSAQSITHQDTPKFEMRAVWLTTLGGIDWPRSHQRAAQQQELRDILDSLKQAGINTVIYQSRIRGTVTYPSVFEPWDVCMTGIAGKSPGYDPLQFAIDECHQRGMQLHAWVVTIPVGKWNKHGCLQLRKKHAKLIKRIGEDAFMNPELPETADYLAKICREIVGNYDVDGIHLDYIRYPEKWRSRPSKAKGREHITHIVRAIHHAVKSLKPWVMVSCAPIGKHDDLLRYHSNGWNARTAVFQDAQQWLREGIMDALFPMMYFRENQFFPFAIDWKEQSDGRIVAPGLGIYFLDPREGRWVLSDIERQLNVIRELGMGHCFFRTKFLLDNVKGVYDLVKCFNTTPALIPPMTWQTAQLPPQPKVHAVGGDGVLRWDCPTPSQSYLTYNIYASEDYPVDISNPHNLVATRLLNNHLTIDTNYTGNYAVTSQDRFGNESMPTQILRNNGKTLRHSGKTSRISIVDKVLELPKKPSTLDAPFIVIETLNGQAIDIRPYSDKRNYDVSSLPNGIYQWRTLNKKGITHRMGFFSVKHMSSCPSSE